MITDTDNDQLNYWKIQWLRWDSNPIIQLVIISVVYIIIDVALRMVLMNKVIAFYNCLLWQHVKRGYICFAATQWVIFACTLYSNIHKKFWFHFLFLTAVVFAIKHYRTQYGTDICELQAQSIVRDLKEAGLGDFVLEICWKSFLSTKFLVHKSQSFSSICFHLTVN